MTAGRSPQVLDLLALNPAAGTGAPGEEPTLTAKEVHSAADIDWVLRQAVEGVAPASPMHTRLVLSLRGGQAEAGQRRFARLLFVELAGTHGGPPEEDRFLGLSLNALASVLLHLAAGAPAPPWDAAPLTAWLRPALAPAPAGVLVLATLAPQSGAAAALATLGWASRLRLPSHGGGVTLRQAGVDWGAMARAAMPPEQLELSAEEATEDGGEVLEVTLGEEGGVVESGEAVALREALAAAEEARAEEGRARRAAEAAAREARAEAEELWRRAREEEAAAREEADGLRAQLLEAQEERDAAAAQVRAALISPRHSPVRPQRA